MAGLLNHGLDKTFFTVGISPAVIAELLPQVQLQSFVRLPGFRVLPQVIPEQYLTVPLRITGLDDVEMVRLGFLAGFYKYPLWSFQPVHPFRVAKGRKPILHWLNEADDENLHGDVDDGLCPQTGYSRAAYVFNGKGIAAENLFQPLFLLPEYLFPFWLVRNHPQGPPSYA